MTIAITGATSMLGVATIKIVFRIIYQFLLLFER